MLWGLLTRLADLSGAVCSAEQLLQVRELFLECSDAAAAALKALLERRHCALGFNNEQAHRSTKHSATRSIIVALGSQVIPESWVMRPLVPALNRRRD